LYVVSLYLDISCFISSNFTCRPNLADFITNLFIIIDIVDGGQDSQEQKQHNDAR